MIYKKSATSVFEKHPCLYTLMFGCVFAKVSQKLVVRNSAMTYGLNNVFSPQTQSWMCMPLFYSGANIIQK